MLTRCILALVPILLILADGRLLPAADAEYVKMTVTYKKVGDLPVRAAVYRPDDQRVRPVVVWIHGGALINGHRDGISGRVRKYAMDRQFALVSIDYRLAPETKLPGIIADVEDAFDWLHSKGAEQFHLDRSRVAVTGGSAGGYLTFVTGHRIKPRPQALVAFWGYGDLVGDWYSQPSPHPRHNRVKVSREEAFKQISGPPVSDSRDRKGNGGLFYLYCRQTGLWPSLVTDGWDPRKDVEKFAPYMPVRNVSSDYPPTLMIHGTDDTDVPHEQSVMMVREFKRHDVEHKLISIKNGEHGLGGGDPEKIDAAYKAAEKFLDRYLTE
jgi:acetyl esterase/lipase